MADHIEITNILNASTLGERIKLVRIALGKSVSEFANLLGVSKGAVSKWENNLVVPAMHNLMEVAKLVNMQVDEFLYFSTAYEKDSATAQEMNMRVFELAHIIENENIQLLYKGKRISEKEQQKIISIMKIMLDSHPKK